MANEIINKPQGEVSILKPQPTLLDIRRDKETYPRLYTMDETQAKAELAIITMMAFQYRGQNIDIETNLALVDSLYAELMEDEDNVGLRYLTMAEIRRVVKRALTGQTKKELYGVNVGSLLTVLTDYARGEGAELQAKVENEGFLRQGDLKYQQLTACAKILAANMKV